MKKPPFKYVPRTFHLTEKVGEYWEAGLRRGEAVHIRFNEYGGDWSFYSRKEISK